MAAKRPKNGWGSHSRAYRDRVAKTASQKYGLSRRQVREMYNRGTFRPGARQPADRIPLKIQKAMPQRIVDRKIDRQFSIEELRGIAYRKLDRTHANTLRWVPSAQKRVRNALEHADENTLRQIISMDSDQIRDLGRYQKDDLRKLSTPSIVRNSVWYDTNGNPHSIFWYH